MRLSASLWKLARFVLRCLALGLVAIVVLVALVPMLLEEHFIFFPAKYPEGDWKVNELPVQDVFFEAADGTKLHGWYIPHPSQVALILYCHGNAGNITHRADILRKLHNVTEASVFIFDYRGYGRSQGRPSEKGLHLDACAAMDWLCEKTGTTPKDVVVLGRSLGGAVAVDVAVTKGAKALVLESTFTSIVDMAAYYYPWLPVRLLLRNRFDAAAKIGQFHGPVFQSHGTADTIVPLEFGRRLFEAANEPKTFVTLPGLDHNDMPPDEYYHQMRAFLTSL